IAAYPQIDMSDVIAKAKKREKGDVFIIPNAASVVGTAHVQDNWAGRRWSNDGAEGRLLASVQVGLTSHKCANWVDHPHPEFGDFGIDKYLPGKLFLGKKEGDSVIF